MTALSRAAGRASLLGALTSPPRPSDSWVRAADASAVDLALVAVAAADAWACGGGLPHAATPDVTRGAWARLARACQVVCARHHQRVTAGHHARAGRALAAIADATNAAPGDDRGAVLCALLLDLLNDRGEPGFAAVSRELARIDRAIGARHEAVLMASVAADQARQAFGARGDEP